MSQGRVWSHVNSRKIPESCGTDPRLELFRGRSCSKSYPYPSSCSLVEEILCCKVDMLSAGRGCLWRGEKEYEMRMKSMSSQRSMSILD